MPLVTVASRPNGDPMATTFSPTSIWVDRPMVAGWRPEAPWALITARSVSGSVPTMVAFLVVPSLKLTEIWPPWPATEATWLLVRISPSELITMPDPEPCSWAFCTLILTTEGSTDLATASTESAAGVTCLRFTTGELAVPPEVDGLSLLTRLSTALNPAAPAIPLRPPTTSAAARIAATAPPLGRPERRSRRGSSRSSRKPKGWYGGGAPVGVLSS